MASRTRQRYEDVLVEPRLGGNLATRVSSDNAGHLDYTQKLNWRRDLDLEIRREGYDYFYPNPLLPIGGQPFPGQIALTSITRVGAIATASRTGGHYFENGEMIIISGANAAAYNGTFIISNVTPTSFDYTVVGAPPTPDPSTAIAAAPVEKINLVGLARRPNGQTAVIAGSPRRLYRYYALDDPHYISVDPADYPPLTPPASQIYWSETPADYPLGTPTNELFYVDENPGYWIVIGWGFSPSGKRWEAEPINGFMCFNNGVDLPCTYRVEDLSVVPIYELRENGVAAVGTIANFNGFLMCMDIAEIHSDVLATWFNTAGLVSVDSLTRVGAVVTATIAAGQPFRLGQRVVISGAAHAEYNGTFPILTATATTFTYEIVGTPVSPDGGGSITARVEDAAYGRYIDASTTDRTAYRVLWGVGDEPRRFASVVPGSIAAGSNILTLDYPALSFYFGQQILITGAGQSHAGGTADNLTANIINIDGASIVIDAFALTTVTSVAVTAADAIGTTAGFEDIQDDGSGIIKALMLADQLVIYKETSVFLCSYVGTVTQPFAFAIRRIAQGTGLFYRNTLVLAITPTESYHVYAGRDMFYRWDLTNQQPMVLPKFEICSDVFYEESTLEETEDIFGFDNGETAELVFAFPSDSSDAALCWDYVWNTLSTTDVAMTSGATIRKPQTGLAVGAGEDWCIFGTSQGAVLVYGSVDIPQTVLVSSITRIGQVATATIAPGQAMFYGASVVISGANNSAYNGTFLITGRTNNTIQFSVVGLPPTPDGGTQILAMVKGTELFYRRGANPFNATRQPYTWNLQGGLANFGLVNSEQDVNQFLLKLGSKCPNTTISVTISGTLNANKPLTAIGTVSLTNPIVGCSVPISARQFYYQSLLSGAGIDSPFQLAGTMWRIAPIDSRSAGRTY